MLVPTGIPSTTYSGSEPLMVETPRIMTRGLAPGLPVLEICTPLILPCRAFMAFPVFNFRSEPFTAEILLVRSPFFTEP